MIDKRWPNLALDTWLLAADSAAVIWLRLGKLALFDAAAFAEAQLMVEEKVEAALLLNWQALTGQLGISHHGMTRKSLAHYRRAVAANRKRLSRR